MRVMVIANCARFTSLAVNETTVNVIKLLKDMPNTLYLVPFGAAVFLSFKTFASFTTRFLRYVLWTVITYVQNVPDILVRP